MSERKGSPITAGPLVDIKLSPRPGARAPFALHGKDGALIGICETIRRKGNRLAIAGWTTCEAAIVACNGARVVAEMGREQVQGEEAASSGRSFRAVVPQAPSGFLILQGGDCNDAFQWRSDEE